MDVINYYAFPVLVVVVFTWLIILSNYCTTNIEKIARVVNHNAMVCSQFHANEIKSRKVD